MTFVDKIITQNNFNQIKTNNLNMKPNNEEVINMSNRYEKKKLKIGNKTLNLVQDKESSEWIVSKKEVIDFTGKSTITINNFIERHNIKEDIIMPRIKTKELGFQKGQGSVSKLYSIYNVMPILIYYSNMKPNLIVEIVSKILSLYENDNFI